MRLIECSLLAILPFSALPAGAQSVVHLYQVPGALQQPNGIDYHPVMRKLIVSEHYPQGAPHDLSSIGIDGQPVPYSPLQLGTDELKIAIARAGSSFPEGMLFTGNGRDGEIIRISPDGNAVTNPWVVLPGSNHGLLRGSLFVDSTGVFGGDLMVVTTLGEVWRVNGAGVPTQLASVRTHLEGLLVVPDNVTKYGPLAGKLLAGAENQGLLYAFTTTGTFVTYQLGVAIEDIDLITCDNFYGVQYPTNRLLAAPGADFAPYVGDILLTQEWSNPNSLGLYRLYWDGTAVRAQELQAAAGGPPTTHWEHVTFAPVGVAPMPDLEAPASVMGTIGVPLSFTVTGRDGDPTDRVRLDHLGLPAGARMNPSQPVGNPVTSRFEWTPTMIGRYRVIFTATDLGGRETRFCVDLEIAECYWLLGATQTNYAFGNERLYTNPLVSWPVTMESIPTLQIPPVQSLNGLVFYNQVVMLNPISFPNHPVQSSNGLAVTIGGGDVEYGNRSGLQTWTSDQARVGGTFRINFRIL